MDSFVADSLINGNQESAPVGGDEVDNGEVDLDDPEMYENPAGNENERLLQSSQLGDGGDEQQLQEEEVEPGQTDDDTETATQQEHAQNELEEQHHPTDQNVGEPVASQLTAEEEEQQIMQEQNQLLLELAEGEKLDALKLGASSAIEDDGTGSGLLTIDDGSTAQQQQQQNEYAPGTAEYLAWNQILARYFALFPDSQSKRVYANGKPRICFECRMCGRKNDAERGDPKTMAYHMKTYHANLLVKLMEFREIHRTTANSDELEFPEPFPEDMIPGEESDGGVAMESEAAPTAGIVYGPMATQNTTGRVRQPQQSITIVSANRRPHENVPSQSRQPDPRLAQLCSELGGNFPASVLADTSDLDIWHQLVFCFTRKLPPAKNSRLQTAGGHNRFTHECMFCSRRFTGVDDGAYAQPLDHFAIQHMPFHRGLLELRKNYDAGDRDAFTDQRLERLIEVEKVRVGKSFNNTMPIQPNRMPATADENLLHGRRKPGFGESLHSQPPPPRQYAAARERLAAPPPFSDSRMAMGTRRSAGHQFVLPAAHQQITIGGNRVATIAPGGSSQRVSLISGYNAGKRAMSHQQQPYRVPPYKRNRGVDSYESAVTVHQNQRSVPQRAVMNNRGKAARPSQQQGRQLGSPRYASPPTATAGESKSVRQVILVYYWLDMHDESNDSTLIMLPVMAGGDAPPSIEQLKDILRMEGQELGESASRFKLDSDGITVVDRLLSLGFDIVSQSHTASEMVWTLVSV